MCGCRGGDHHAMVKVSQSESVDRQPCSLKWRHGNELELFQARPGARRARADSKSVCHGPSLSCCLSRFSGPSFFSPISTDISSCGCESVRPAPPSGGPGSARGRPDAAAAAAMPPAGRRIRAGPPGLRQQWRPTVLVAPWAPAQQPDCSATAEVLKTHFPSPGPGLRVGLSRTGTQLENGLADAQIAFSNISQLLATLANHFRTLLQLLADFRDFQASQLF